MTSFHHQPEAQHPKSSAIHNNAGRLPHLLGVKRRSKFAAVMSANDQSGHVQLSTRCCAQLLMCGSSCRTTFSNERWISIWPL